MSSSAYPSNEESLPSASFQKLCHEMLDGASNSITKQNVEDFRVILHMIMHDCSKANIEAGKTWFFDHCQTSQQIAAILEYVLTLTVSRTGQEDRIHMVYLVNDVLYHSTRKQKVWMKEAMIPYLKPLLKLAYDAADSSEYKAKVMKVINIWSDKSILNQQLISDIKRDVSDGGNRTEQQSRDYTQQPSYPPSAHQQPQSMQQHPFPPPPMMHAAAQQQQPQAFQQNPMFAMRPPPPPPPFPLQHPNQPFMRPPPPPAPFGFQPYPPQPFLPPPPPHSLMPHPPFMPSMPLPSPSSQQQQPPPLHDSSSNTPATLPSTPPTPKKPYHELPAGLMLLVEHEDYQPIRPSDIKPLHPEQLRQPSQDLMKAVDEFYHGLEKIEAMDEDVVTILDEQKEANKACLQMDAQGWEKGYLDSYFDSMAQRKKERDEEMKRRKELPKDSREAEREIDQDADRRGRERTRSSRRRRRSSSSHGSRSSSREIQRRRRRDRSRSYSRGRRSRSSRSPRRYHSRSRSRGRASADRHVEEERGRSRYHRYRTPSRSPSSHRRRRSSYSRSPRHLSSLSPRRRSKHSPSPSSLRRRGGGDRTSYPSSSTSSSSRRNRKVYDSRSRSRSPSSADKMGGLGSNAVHAGLGSGAVLGFDPMVPPPAVTAENRYMGLGSKSAAQQAADEYENFRRVKSKTYNRREPYQPFTCYKCNKAGHLARECNSL